MFQEGDIFFLQLPTIVASDLAGADLIFNVGGLLINFKLEISKNQKRWYKIK
ncbi:MAG: hypothetical protein QME61_02025 [Patescibacteria group bacterium]|nr:hypothetical protein [Patescibacteria group bacterium]